MRTTAEVRWIIEEPLPDAILAWYGHPGTARAEPARVDSYLVFPGCSSVGVKIRHGRLEIKALQGAPRPFAPAGGVEGALEIWVKWTASGPPLDAPSSGPGGDAAWVDLSKSRLIRVFACDRQRAVEVAADQQVELGCLVELTRLRLGQVVAWSLGFEAFGPASDVRAGLRLVARALLGGDPLPYVLTRAQSGSYAAWLAQARAGAGLAEAKCDHA